MNTFSAIAIGFAAIGLFSFAKSKAPANKEKLSTDIYDYSFTDINGNTVKISDFKGKKILFVNVASFCGNTPQYAPLEALSKKYAGKLVILGFPCNQFGMQEPKGPDSIKKFCSLKYGVTFTLSQKIEVKGKNQFPIYSWLTKKELNGVMDSEVKWNFQKYLIDEQGHFVQMYSPKTQPDDPQVLAAIEK